MLAPDQRKTMLQAFGKAAKEENWFLYAITDRGPKQKPGKFPVKVHRPFFPTATEKAACVTLQEAMFSRDTYNTSSQKIAKHNKAAQEFAKRQKKKNKPWPPIIRYEVGYYPREGSAFVLFDLDDCRDPSTGEITRPEIAEALEGYDGYIEPSTSGTGLRLVMPREEGDEKLSGAGEANGVGFLASATGKGMALTLRPDRLTICLRGWDMTFEKLIALRGDLKTKRPKGRKTTDAALDFANISLDDLRDMLACINNDERFEERGRWVGFVKSIAEVFVPRGLGDAAFEIVDEWTKSRDGNWDPEANRAVWDEPPGGRMTFATVIHHAKKGGWKRMVKPEGNYARFCIVDGRFYDRHTHKFRTDAEIWKLTIDEEMVYASEDGLKEVGPGKEKRVAWLAQHLPQFDGTVFDPLAGETVDDPERRPPGVYINTFRPLRSIPYGGREPTPWLDHLARIVPDVGDRLWVLEWMAFVAQKPGRKINWAPVFIGPEGSGKDTLFRPLAEWFGNYLHPSVKLRDVTHNFNAWQNETLVGIVQEKDGGRFTTKEDQAEALKNLLAAPPDYVTLELKGKDAVMIPNIVNAAFFVNGSDALAIGRQSRRYFPVDSSWAPADENAAAFYFDPLYAYLNNGGCDDVIAYLQIYPIKRVRARMRAPRSSAFDRIVDEGLGPVGQALLEEFEDREWVTMEEAAFEVQNMTQSKNVVASALKEIGFHRVRVPGDTKGRLRGRTGRGKRATHTIYFRGCPAECPIDEIKSKLVEDKK